MENTENITGLEYNTQRPHLRVPGYGRNIQKMINHALAIKDIEERNKIAHAIVSVMGQVNPQLKEIEDLNHKLWTHLFLISDFELEVDSPYPKPSASTFTDKPEVIGYPDNKIRYNHYGIAVQEMLKVIGEFEEGDKKDYLAGLMVNLMKRSYLTWNRESVENELITNQLTELSGGTIKLPENFEIDSTNELLKARPSVNLNPKQKNNKNKNQGRNKNQNRNHKKRY